MSASLIRDAFKALMEQRDKALEAVTSTGGTLDGYVSYIAVRDSATAAYIEPWVEGAGVGGGLERDWRFG
jgi:hypothetical protein